MKHLKLIFACLLTAIFSIGQVWATEETVSWTASTGALGSAISAVNGTAQGTISTGSFSWTYTRTLAILTSGKSDYISMSGSYMQCGSGNAGENVEFRTSNIPGTIKSVTVLAGSKDSRHTGTITVGGTDYNAGAISAWASSAGGNWVGTGSSSGEIVISISCNNKKSPIYIASITVVYEESTAGCTSEIAITKADNPANGTFALDNSGTVCIDEGNATVNVTATPNTGYHLATVVSAEGTIGDIEGNTCQITNIGASTTISVTFAENPKYKVSFNVGGSTASQADITEASAGAGITLPDGPTPTCSGDGWTFAGWKETSAVDVETTTAPTLLLAGANYKPAANCTLYAVYKRTESGAVTDQDVTETFENQEAGSTYNSTMDYAASASNANIAWTMYYGCVSSNVKLTGDKSAQMRWYKSATSNLGYIQSTTPISGLQSVSFNAKTDNANSSTVKISVWYSTDGDTWTKVNDNEAAPTATGAISATIDGTVGTDYYVRIGVGDEGTAPSSSSAKLTIDDVQFNFKAAAITTYYLSAPTCSCEQLGTPSVTVTNKTYNSAKLTWAAVDNADKYLVKFNGVDQDATSNLYFDATGLDAATPYTYQVKALAEEGQDDWCDGAFSAEANFTTEPAPAATLTLSENTVTHNLAGDHTLGETVTLPSADDCSKKFRGWSANENCETEPELHAGDSYTLNATSQTLYAVYAKVMSVSDPSLIKQVTGATFAAGEKLVIVAVVGDDQYALYRETTSSSYVKNWAFDNNVATVAADAKKYVTLEAGATSGKYYMGDATNGYVYSSGSNNLSVDATNKTEWTIVDNEDGTFGFNQGRLLSCRSDLESDKVNLYRLAGSTPGGTYKLDVYKYSAGDATYGEWSTTCTAPLASPTFSVDPADGPFTTAQSVELSATEGTIYYNINSADDPTSASTPYTGAIDVDACGSTTIKAIAISSTNQSLVASATYVLNLPIPENAENNPYSIATAKSVIDGGCYNNEDVYVTGTVASAQLYNSGTYTVTLEDGFQFYYLYKAAGETPFDSGDETIEAGDVLVAFGKLGMHNTTYQLDHGYLVSRTPAPKTPIDSDIDNPISVAAAVNYIDNAATYDLSEDEFVAGIVESIAECSQHEGTYDIIVLDATDNTKQIKFFGCDVKTFAGIKQYDQITGKGKLFKYYSTYELNYPCEVVALTPYVAPVVDVTGVEVDETATVKVGKTVQLTANVIPANASNKNVTWSVKAGDESKASVSATGLVTGLVEGEAVIVVTTEEGSFTDECTVTVTAGINFAAGDFVLVEDAVELTEGTYVIVAGSGDNNAAMKYYAGSDNNHKAKAAIKEGKYLHYDSEFGVYEIKNYVINEEVVGISFYNDDAENYFALPANSNQLKVNAEQNNNSSWTVAVSEGVTTLTNKAFTNRTLRYNSGSSCFASYETGQKTIALYKYVTPAAYRVYYDDNVAEEEIEVPAYQSVNGENKVTITAVEPVRDGYLFSGWKDGEANVYEAGVEYTLSADLTLYAQWTTATVSTLSYNPNGGTLIGGETAIADADVAEGTNLTIEANVYEKGDNYVFAGWKLNDDIYQPGDAFVMPANNVEFVAQWNEVEVSDYTLVTNVSQLQAGDKVIIVAADYNVAAGSAAATFRNVVDIEKTSDKSKLIFGASMPTEFTLGIPADGEYSFNDGDGFMYESAAKSVKVQAESFSWSISIDAQAIATISATNELRYNNGSPRFTTYASGQAALQLYRKPGEPEPVYEELREGVVAGRYYTVCLSKKVVAFRGGNFWSMSKRTTDMAFLEEEKGELPAGTPYIFEVTGTKLEVVYEGAATDVAGTNGALHGTFVDMDQDALSTAASTAGSDIWLLSNNQLYNVTTAGADGNSLSAGRAYIVYGDLDEVSEAPHLPGRRVRGVPMQGQTATALDNAEASEKPMKMMIDGQLFIIRGEKMYDATGRLVK